MLKFLARETRRQETGSKSIQKGKEEIKLPLAADDLILYLKDTTDPTWRLNNTHFQQSSRIQNQDAKNSIFF
jgi:hypothetical protein